MNKGKVRKKTIVTLLIALAAICMIFFRNEAIDFMEETINPGHPSLLEHFFSPKDAKKLEKMVIRKEQSLKLGSYTFTLKEYIHEATLSKTYALIEIRKPGTNMRKDYRKNKFRRNPVELLNLVTPYSILKRNGTATMDIKPTKAALYAYIQLSGQAYENDSTIRICDATHSIPNVPSDEKKELMTTDRFYLKETKYAKHFRFDEINMVISPFRYYVYKHKFSKNDVLEEHVYEVVFKNGKKKSILDYDQLRPGATGDGWNHPWFDDKTDFVAADFSDFHDGVIDIEQIDYLLIDGKNKVYPEAVG